MATYSYDPAGNRAEDVANSLNDGDGDGDGDDDGDGDGILDPLGPDDDDGDSHLDGIDVDPLDRIRPFRPEVPPTRGGRRAIKSGGRCSSHAMTFSMPVMVM